MYCLSGSEKPWLARLDHIICETSDIEGVFDAFMGLGFPCAWPIGRFWPQGRTAGIGLGGINLELLQPDEGAPSVATIRTLAFEPVNLEQAVARFEELGLPMRVAEKWESDPELLKLRGFDGASPQFICRNAYPLGETTPFDFFLCEYSPALRARLTQPLDIPPVVQIVMATPQPQKDWPLLNSLFGLPRQHPGVEIVLSETPHDCAEVIEIRSDRGSLDLGAVSASFRFV